MSFRFTASGRALFLVWESVPTKEDVSKVERLFTEARKAAKAPLVFVGVIPAQIKRLPDADVRAAMSRAMPAISAHCEVIHVAIEGDEVHRSLLRKLLGAISLLSRGTPLQMHSTLGAALAAAGKLAAEDLLAAYEAAQQAGMTEPLIRAAG